MLPSMCYSDRIGRAVQVKFGGYCHTLSAGEGAIYDMRNLTGENAPLLSSRRPRSVLRTLEKPNGLYAADSLFYVDGTSFCVDGVPCGTVTDTPKRFACLGAYLLIFPDKAYYHCSTGEFGSLESTYTGAVTIGAGSYAGESAAANTVRADGVNWADYFRIGDAVTIAGCTKHAENNKTVIIREIAGNALRFYENTFTTDSAGDSEDAVTVARTLPALDYVCVNENRLWGCCGDTIYASKLGDPFNFNVFDGLSTDSYAVNVGSAGSFTGCVSYLGYAIFFKEDQIYKIYGTKPSNFKTMASASLGVAQGSDGSLAVAGETLYYLSREGVMAYTGGLPECISSGFGAVRYSKGVGASSGLRYYLSVQSGEGDAFFVYDTQTEEWYREDDTRLVGSGRKGELYLLDSTGKLFLCGDAQEIPADATQEECVKSMVEFGDFTEQDPCRKGLSRLLLRLELERGSTVTVSIMFDSDGVWRRAGQLRAAKKRSFDLPIIPRRCDHYRVKIEGEGAWTLYSLARVYYSGSHR